MSRAATALRTALEQLLAGEEAACLARLRDPSDDLVPRSRARGRWLASESGKEAFEEALASGEWSELETACLRGQIDALPHALAVLSADARLRTALARGTLQSGEPLQLPARLARLARADDGRGRTEAAREIEQALRPIALEHVAAHARAEEPLLVARKAQSNSEADAPAALATNRPRGSLIVSAFSVEAMTQPLAPALPHEPWLVHAQAFLSETDAAAQDAVQHALREHPSTKLADWHLVLRGLRAPQLDSNRGAQQRWQRVAAWLRGLGFEPELQSRMRAEPDRGGALPTAKVLALAVPHDVRVAQIATNYGVLSDVEAAEGVGRALGLSLVHAALPPELRWPLGASVAGALGGLALQLWGDRDHLARVQDMASAEAERVGRLAGTLALLQARAWTAIALTELTAADEAQTRLEAFAGALGRALCCDLPPGVAGLLGANRVHARARAQEALAGLALHVALRDRFDVDYYRNPRSAELLRSVCERGNALQIEGLCGELATSLGAAAARAMELVT
jgi:hypothetical protein